MHLNFLFLKLLLCHLRQMQSISDIEEGSLFDQLASAKASEPVSCGDERLAKVRGFQAIFKQVCRTPDIVRMLLQKEFHFTGQVDSDLSKSGKHAVSETELLKTPWFSSTFVLPNTQNMPEWVKKFVEEQQEGRTVVSIVPARTNTAWFHEVVLPNASEVRFIKGRLTRKGHKAQNAFPDMVLVFSPHTKHQTMTGDPKGAIRLTQTDEERRSSRTRVAIVASSTSGGTVSTSSNPE